MYFVYICDDFSIKFQEEKSARAYYEANCQSSGLAKIGTDGKKILLRGRFPRRKK